MHIAFINRGIGLYQGGGERYDLSLAQALRKGGHRVSFITGKPLFAKPKFLLEFPTIYLRSPYLRELSYILPKGWIFNWLDGALFDWVVRKFLKNNPNHADIYQVSGWPVLASRIIRDLHKPVVLRMPGPAREVIDLQDQLSVIVANGDAFRQMQPNVRRKIQNIPPAVDSGKFYQSKALRSRWRKNLALSPNHVVIVYSGRLVPIKNPTLMINGFTVAFRKNPNLRLIMAGDGPLLNQLKKQAKDLGVMSVVTFLGHQSIDALNGIYNVGDILAIPSRYDNYPNTVLEAMMVGLPVVGTNVGGIPTQISHNYNGLIVEPEDPKGLGSAIVKLANQTSMRKKIGVNARKLTEGYTWDKVAQQFERIYKQELRKI